MGNDSSHLSGLEVNEKAVEITDFWAHYHATVNDTGSFFNLKDFGAISMFKNESPVLGTLWSNHSPLEKCSINRGFVNLCLRMKRSDTDELWAPLIGNHDFQSGISNSHKHSCSPNLMKYRHPCMLRYVWHWQQRGLHYLTTECVQPLTQALADQDPIQICIGLNHIAQALDFLHNNASLSHNNLSMGAVYVLPDGTWKLGAMEMARPFKEMSANYLKQSKKYRYTKALDPNEELGDSFITADQYAFAQLVEEVFKGRNIDDLPYWQDFKNYCQKELKNPIASQRPNFSTILKHDFFNHDFISIHKFFVSLPVKTEKEKSVFFNDLLEKLKGFNEEIVARQLSGPLLSRLVLLDATAREKLLPHVLVPKQDGETSDTGLFTRRVFVSYITPHLLKMFRVRDIQVRLLLLKYFQGYSSTFTKEDLTTHVLPELLLGIKDTSDNLVSMTLYCLAELVPILGAAAVIGGKRSKLFADGRPLTHSRIKTEAVPQKTKQKRPTILDKIEEDANEKTFVSNLATGNVERTTAINGKVMSENSDLTFGSRDSVELEHSLFLHERPSPDGGEDLDSEIVLNSSNGNKLNDAQNVEDDNWSDWDTEDTNNVNNHSDVMSLDTHISNDVSGGLSDSTVHTDLEDNSLQNKSHSNSTDRLYLQKAALDAKTRKLTDISELDIKNQKFTVTKNGSTSSLSGAANKDEFDFFLDMEPVIEKASIFTIEQKNEKAFSNLNVDNEISSKLNFVPVDNDETKAGNDGWGDTDWDD